MKTRLTALLLAGLLLMMIPAAAGGMRKSVFLDAALPFLEEDNPFLKRYNELTGRELKAKYPLGCPYFWGGRIVSSILRPASPGSSSDYYRKDRKYLYGLDCVGFTRAVFRRAGYEDHPQISELLNRSLHTDKLIRGVTNASGEERAARLKIGDLAAIRHMSGGFHIAMYCGTLADYGYTDETVPEALKPYLLYPLLIHCTGSSEYHERYRQYLEEQEEPDIFPPYGGVIISIIDVPESAAPGRTSDVIGESVPCFDLEGYCLQVTDLSREKQVRCIRWRVRPEKD